ncbi:MAG TPA: neutral zinc metallopeptidase [Acidimicrobiia bacterium]
MRFRRGASLDTGQISDRRGTGVGGLNPGVLLGGGGGGVVGVILLVVLLLGGFGGGGGSGGGFGLGDGGGDNEDLAQKCQTGADANQSRDCRIVAVVNSVQEYWSGAIDGYRPATTVFFDGQVSTGCGVASSAVGPFYCPVDSQVYIDLGFYDELEQRFGARGGPFAEAYVIAHEYGHHVQNLLGASSRVAAGSQGRMSASVRLELQADCYAGVWASHALETRLISALTNDDIADGLDAAAAVGDDRIQEAATGEVDPHTWTHGSARQRQKWFTTGYRTGNPDRCDTFAADAL